MRVAVGGGRLRADNRLVRSVLGKLLKDFWGPDTVVIEGDAKGYDRLAGAWARRNHLTNIKVRIDPEIDGWRDDAPRRRNQRVIDQEHPELFVAFDGGPGTRDMMRRCLRHGVIIYEVEVVAENFLVWSWAGDGGRATLITEGKIK